VSNQVISDPQQLRDFARNLDTFNHNLRDQMSWIHSCLSGLADGWRDAQFQHFSEVFDRSVHVLNGFLEESDRYVHHLNSLAEPLDEYHRRGRSI
jgi:hypothetical protein